MELSIKDDLWWGADLRLASWAGYQSRLGPYGSRDKPTASNGTATLIFAPEGRGVEPLSEREMRLITWFEKNESKVAEAVKIGVIDWCSPASVERKTRFDFSDDFPAISDERGLKENVGLHAVYVHQLDVGGVPYLGYEFGCEWEEEHGLGVLMHGYRVVEVGFANTAFNLWVAQNDADALSTDSA